MADLKIFKYPFQVQTFIEIDMPKGSHVLTVQEQGGAPCIWAIVDTDMEPEFRRFRLYGTGHLIDIDVTKNKYIGTFQLLEGNFVGHLFEVEQ